VCVCVCGGGGRGTGGGRGEVKVTELSWSSLEQPSNAVGFGGRKGNRRGKLMTDHWD